MLAWNSNPNLIMRRLIPLLATSLALVSLVHAKPVATADEAVDVFRAVWRRTLAKRLETRPFIGQLKAQVFEDGKVQAKSSSSAEVLKLIRSTLTEKEERELTAYGKKDDLEPEREVWLVTHPGDFGSGFQAVIDPKDGDLVFMWITPEG